MLLLPDSLRVYKIRIIIPVCIICDRNAAITPLNSQQVQSVQVLTEMVNCYLLMDIAYNYQRCSHTDCKPDNIDHRVYSETG